MIYYKTKKRNLKERYSGNIIVRMNPSVHAELARISIEKGKSINLILNEIIEQYVDIEALDEDEDDNTDYFRTNIFEFQN